jgi:hypothetical protein
MARTIRRKTGRKKRSNKKSTRRNRRKVVGGINIKKSLALALGLLSGAKGMYADANEATLTLKNGEKTLVKTGWGGVYIDEKYIRQPVLESPEDERPEYENALSTVSNENSLSTISSEQPEAFKPVKLLGQETKWVWVKNDDLCEKLHAVSLEPKYRPNENILKCKVNPKTEYLALPSPG